MNHIETIKSRIETITILAEDLNTENELLKSRLETQRQMITGYSEIIARKDLQIDTLHKESIEHKLTAIRFICLSVFCSIIIVAMGISHI